MCTKNGGVLASCPSFFENEEWRGLPTGCARQREGDDKQWSRLRASVRAWAGVHALPLTVNAGQRSTGARAPFCGAASQPRPRSSPRSLFEANPPAPFSHVPPPSRAARFEGEHPTGAPWVRTPAADEPPAALGPPPTARVAIPSVPNHHTDRPPITPSLVSPVSRPFLQETFQLF